MKKHKIAIIGCGVMANTWVRYTLDRPNCEIVALADLNLQTAQNMAARYGLSCPVFTSAQEAIEKTSPTLVYDITLPFTHCEVSSFAMRHGCDVFGEKPVSAEPAHAKELLAVAKETGRFYAIMQNRRYLSQTRDIAAFLRSGALGKPTLVCADFFLGAHFQGFRSEIDHPLLLEMAVHTFDQARCMLGADAVSAYCQEWNPAGSWYKGDATALGIFEMTDGAVVSYRGSWTAEGCQTSWESAWRIQCERGTVTWDGENTIIASALSAVLRTKTMCPAALCSKLSRCPASIQASRATTAASTPCSMHTSAAKWLKPTSSPM